MATPSTAAGTDPLSGLVPRGRGRKVSPDRAALEAEVLLLEEQARRMAERPLAFYQLWDRPAPRTSQRRIAQNLGERATVVSGGNRSGKSSLGAALTACAVLGRDHPDTLAFCALNGLDASYFPKAPTRVACITRTSRLSARVQRALIAELIPGLAWRNKDGDGEADATHHETGSKVFFLTAEAGPEKFEADRWHWLWADEEMDEAVWDAGRMRLVDFRGKAVFTFVPLSGQGWIYRRYFADSEPGALPYHLHGFDNPHIPADELEAILRTYGPLQRAARERGEFTALDGRVYPDFSRDLHVVMTPFAIPPEWPRYVALDFGTRNPFAAVWVAVDPKDDTAYAYREYLQAERPLSHHAAKLKELMALDVRPVEPGPEGGLRTEPVEPEWVVADPEDRGSRLSLAREHGIYTIPARKDVVAGISAVAARLAPDADGKPHLFVFPECKQLIRELEGYVWTPGGGKGDAPERPLKKDDHAVDALRYLVFALDRVRDLV